MSNTEHSFSLHDMAKAGVHVGHHTSKWHPKMKPFIYGSRNKFHVINLENTSKLLQEALTKIEEIVSSGKDITFVATKKHVVPLVQESAAEAEMPYVVKRWVGGVFTNRKVISKRIKQLKQLEEKLAQGKLQSYTKKERKVFQDKVEKGNKLFAGLKNMKGLPGAIFVEDVNRDILAIKEARTVGIPVIGLVDTNTNPELVDYPIPANDDALSSVSYIYQQVVETIKESKKKQVQLDTEDDSQSK